MTLRLYNTLRVLASKLNQRVIIEKFGVMGFAQEFHQTHRDENQNN